MLDTTGFSYDNVLKKNYAVFACQYRRNEGGKWIILKNRSHSTSNFIDTSN